MQDRCPGSRRIGPARLDGYRLVFDLPSRRWGGHAAGIEPARGRTVWGVLWEVAPASLGELDQIEASYRRIPVEVRAGSTGAAAFTYVIEGWRRSPAAGRPTGAYLEHLVEGGRQAGLPLAYLEYLAEWGREEGADPVFVS